MELNSPSSPTFEPLEDRRISWGQEATFVQYPDLGDEEPRFLAVGPIYFGPGRQLERSDFVNREMRDQYDTAKKECRDDCPYGPPHIKAETSKMIKKNIKRANEMWFHRGQGKKRKTAAQEKEETCDDVACDDLTLYMDETMKLVYELCALALTKEIDEEAAASGPVVVVVCT
jgi:hypothetical protein